MSWEKRVVFASEANWRTRQAISEASPRRSRHAQFSYGRRLPSKSKHVTLGEGKCYRDRETTGQGDKETRGQGDEGKRRQGDKGTRRRDVFLLVSLSPCLLVPLSPCPPFSLSPSPWLCGSVALWLVRQVRSRNRRYLRRKRCQLPTSTLGCPNAPLRSGSGRSSARRPAWSGN